MHRPNGERTNLTKLQWIQVRADNFKRFYGDWEKDGIELRRLVRDDETGSHKRRISGSTARPTRSSDPRPLVDGNGEPVIFYHGTKDVIEKGFNLKHTNREDNGQNRGRITETGLVAGGSRESRAISGKDTQRENARGLGGNSRNDPQTFYHGTACDIICFLS
jgi:hypothetical protein